LTTTGRFKVEAIGQPFFDISHANLTVTAAPPTPTTPTVKLTATGSCDFGLDGNKSFTTLATPNITRSYKIIVSGTLAGLTPGHSYTLHASNGTLAAGAVNLGTADAHGNLRVTNLVDNGGASGYTGSTQRATVTDNASPHGAATASTIKIADNCSQLVAGSSHDRLMLGTLKLIQQGDGNLVLYLGNKALWSSHTNYHPGAHTVMQGDGNLVIYSPAGKALWSSRTHQKASPPCSAILSLQGDKNLVLREKSPVSRVLWATYTN